MCATPSGSGADGAGETGRFAGAKLALFLGPRLFVMRRDERPDIAWPGYLDLPGGGREAGETPEACVLRETLEETGLAVPRAALVWRRAYARPHGTVWFFAAHLPPATEAEVRFGDEGSWWGLMAPEAFAAHPEAVPHFRTQLREYLATLG